METQIYTCFVVLLSIGACSNACTYREQANVLEDQGRYQEAIILLDKAIEKDPLFVDAYLDRGADQATVGSHNEAINNFTEVIGIDTSNVLAYYNRATNYYNIGNYCEAYIDIQRAYRLTAKYKIGDIHFAVERDPNKAYSSIMSIDNDRYAVVLHEIIYERGRIYLELDSLNRAYEDMNYCIDKEGVFAAAYYWRSIVNKKMGNIEKACEDFNTVLNYGVMEARVEIEKYCLK